MEALPLELHEQIFAYLLSRQDIKQLVALPVSTSSERTNIYHLRLTSRRICTGASQSFVRIVQDVPTECRQGSLDKLAALLGRPDISNSLTCLTLNTCKLFLTEETTNEHYEINSRSLWLHENLYTKLVAIIYKAPRLRHLICIVEAIRGCNIFKLESLRTYYMKRNVARGSDPIRFIQEALVTTKLKDALDTIVFLNTSHEGLENEILFHCTGTSVEYPNLQHLALALTARHISDCRVRAPRLTSLHVVLDNRSFSMDECLYESYHFPEIHRGLRQYTISGRNGPISTESVLDCIAPVLEGDLTLPLMEIRDMTVVTNPNHHYPKFKGNGRVELLVFENVTYGFRDHITSGLGKLREMDYGWQPFVDVLRRADDNRIILSTGQDHSELLSGEDACVDLGSFRAD